ncbi:YccT family protein [Amphritea japonica]|uniref:Uncharacterized protein n=1 Tax=Amphritea japonica ATCC BAA-1530 TaxID=1278309 RepID=A0A7R6PJ72_9GAMM|nr:DUF2057 domain-containing protein [Amphritea japonica]BBB25430.1 conserved hypothetical protein [Amphritea japonica ATCC BAA-1530]
MRFSLSFFFVLILFCSSIRADINLSVGSGITLIAVNGAEINRSSLFDHADNIVLPNGKNQILVQYSTEIRSSGSFNVENSDLHVLVFSVTDKTISLLTPEIKRLSEFKRFNAGKLWILKDSFDRSIKYISKPLLKSGFQINRDYEAELKTLNESGGDISISNVFVSEKSPPQNKFLNEYNRINLPEIMLEYWYLKADVDTRNRFKSSVVGQ